MMRMTHLDHPPLRVCGLFGHGSGWPLSGSQTAKALLTNEAQLVVSGSQEVDHGALVCPTLLCQGQWVTPLKWQSASRSCMSISPITFRDSDGDTALRNFRPFGRALRHN